ncbi:DNA-binding transcriptional LysR family regulator [Labrys monachus]|uniref:DNA-binding transcriptional LysR family regulator n=2 Tax=Labrys monachus TaxID=217067 RepID=A0ABU0F9K2_9HYPH|nr:DNA-binding transcriptional LysR family regulator [Labrys monachus]
MPPHQGLRHMPWSSFGLDLVTLRVFKAAVEERSLVRAAERERLALSAISRRISEMEARIGTALLRRHDRGVEPTAAGEALMRHLDTLFEVLEHTIVDMEAFAAGHRGQIRLQANLSVLAGSFPEELASFQKSHPDIDLYIEERISADIIHSVQIGTAEIGLVSATMHAPNLQLLHWRTDHLVAVLPCDHRLVKKEGSLRFRDLVEDSFVGLSTSMALQNIFRREAAMLGMTLKERVNVASFDGVRRMIQAGFGVGILPEGGVTPYSDTAGLVAKPLAEPWADRPLSICIRDMQTLSSAGRLLVSHLLRKEVSSRS